MVASAASRTMRIAGALKLSAYAPARGRRSPASSVPALVHQRALLDPRHHGAQLFAHGFGRMGAELGAHGLERSLVDAVLQHPVLGELARLDVGQDALHLGARVGID